MRAFYSNRLIKHGLTAMLVGLLGGFLLAFSMVGGASISPIPVFFQFELPGPSSGWRILHVGTLMNGIMALAIEASLAGALAYIPAILAAVTSIWATAVLLLSEPEYESSGK